MSIRSTNCKSKQFLVFELKMRFRVFASQTWTFDCEDVASKVLSALTAIAKIGYL